ncbi:MAG: hypothetical protein WB239_01045, partial [Acidimicrobiia bacterium]
TGLAVGAALTCVRLGIHGVAGDRTPGLVASAFLLILLVEMGADSIESRLVPMASTSTLLRSAMTAAAAAAVVGVLSLVTAVEVGGSTRLLVGLGAALAVAALVLWVAGPPGSPPQVGSQEPSE